MNIVVRVVTANRAAPDFDEPNREHGHEVNMNYIKASQADGETLGVARQTVVVSERDALCSIRVDAELQDQDVPLRVVLNV